MDAALEVLQRWGSSSSGAVGSNLGARRNAEQNYGLAYQALVREGLRPQIRGKYRP